jgi:hypothetical protein
MFVTTSVSIVVSLFIKAIMFAQTIVFAKAIVSIIVSVFVKASVSIILSVFVKANVYVTQSIQDTSLLQSISICCTKRVLNIL